MVVEDTLVINGAKGGTVEVEVLRGLVTLLIEKTKNLEQIQATYEVEVESLHHRIAEQANTIEILSADVKILQDKVSRLSKSEMLESRQCSQEPISPGLSASLQDVFNQLEFLNDTANKLDSISSISEGKRTPSIQSLQLNEEDLTPRVEEGLTKTPILVKTLSYDTSTYNDSFNCSDEEINDICAIVENVATVQKVPELITPKSLKKRGVVSHVMVKKIPIILRDYSFNDDLALGTDADDVKTPVNPTEFTPGIMNHDNKDDEQELGRTESQNGNPVSDEGADFQLKYPWTRSDTFDVIPVSQTSHIAVPVKPKRGVLGPLHEQLPTERDDSVRPRLPETRPQLSTDGQSDQSTFSQVSSNRSSSFDYEVQYITPESNEENV